MLDQLVLNFVTTLTQSIKHSLILRRLNSSPGVRSNEMARTMARVKLVMKKMGQLRSTVASVIQEQESKR